MFNYVFGSRWVKCISVFSPVVPCFVIHFSPLHKIVKRFDYLWVYIFSIVKSKLKHSHHRHNHNCCLSFFQSCSFHAVVKHSLPLCNWHGCIQERICWHLVIHSSILPNTPQPCTALIQRSFWHELELIWAADKLRWWLLTFTGAWLPFGPQCH